MSGECLDHDLLKQLASLVERLTTSGNASLDTQLMKKFKKICRTSDLYVEHAFHLLMTQLSEEHSEIRLSCSQVIDELFSRSHAFRELLLTDFQNFLELTVETDQQHQPLPPPKAAANKLKTDTLKAVQQWQEKFGEGYKKLALGYNFLQQCKHVNFTDIRARSLAERRRREQEELRKQKALAAKLEKVRKEIAELQKEITDTVTEAENCVDLLLPKPDSLFNESDFTSVGDVSNNRIPDGNSLPKPSAPSAQLEAKSSGSTSCLQDFSCENGDDRLEDHESVGEHEGGTSQVSEKSNKNNRTSRDLPDTDGKGNDSSKTNESNEICVVIGDSNDNDEDSDASGDEFEDVDADDAEERGLVQTHGLGSRKYNLEIEIETDEVHLKETEDNRDLFCSLKDSSCLITLRYLPQVIKWLEVLSKTGGSETEIKNLIDLKQRLEHVKAQCAELCLESEPDAPGKLSDSDNEMEEVPEKEGYEPVIPAHLRAEYGLEATSSSKYGASSSSSASSTASKDQKHNFSDTAGSSKDLQKSSGTQWTLIERNTAVSSQDPTSRAANIKKVGLQEDVKPSTSKDMQATDASDTSGKGEKVVPTLSFGPDLAYWGAHDKVEAPTIVKFLATGESFRSLSFSYGVGVTSVHRFVSKVCKVLWDRLSPTYITVPDNSNDWKLIAASFASKWNFPHCLGVLDGKHVVLRAPSRSGSLYFNYKSSFSTVLLALVDANLKFIYIDIGSYGCNCYGGIFAHSTLGKAMTMGALNFPPNAHLPYAEHLGPLPFTFVADEAFPLSKHILRPFPGRGLTLEKKIFNYRLSRARRIVESAFVVLAARWRIFHTKSAVKPQLAKDIVKATVVLHNMLQIQTTPAEVTCLLQEVENIDLQRDMQAVGGKPSLEPMRVRDAFINYFCNIDPVPWQKNHVQRGIFAE